MTCIILVSHSIIVRLHNPSVPTAINLLSYLFFCVDWELVVAGIPPAARRKGSLGYYVPMRSAIGW